MVVGPVLVLLYNVRWSYLIIVDCLTLVIVHSGALRLVASLALLVLHGGALALVGDGALLRVESLTLLLILGAALLLVLRLALLALLAPVPAGNLHPLERTVPGCRGSVQRGYRGFVRSRGRPGSHH